MYWLVNRAEQSSCVRGVGWFEVWDLAGLGYGIQ